MTKRRRHGEELENAIFESTIAILDSDGLEGLTFSKVASLAKTSRPVIYRRWDSPFHSHLMRFEIKSVKKIVGTCKT